MDAHEYRGGGYEAIAPRSRAAQTIPHRTPDELEEEMVALRTELTDLGVDTGAATIAYHLGLRHAQVPSVCTIWRVLRRRGLVTPQPHKRPRSSWIRFEATLPNECWQSDVTHFRLADGTEVDIVNFVNFVDDHSRLAVASRVVRVATAPKVLEIFRHAGACWGLPAALLTDQAAPDAEVRPHRARGRRPPREAFEARDKARPSGPKIRVGAGVRVRRDRIDKGGKVTLRHGTKLHHIGVGHAHKGKRVILLVAGLDVRVVSEDGELLRHLTLDPSRDYQPQAS